MKCSIGSLLVAALVVSTGCNQGTTGGPGATNQSGKKQSVAGHPDETFSLSVPTLSTKVKQGESKEITIGIKRGTNFNEDVTLKFSDVPKGVSIDPAMPVIKHSDNEAKVKITAADDAALGDFKVELIGQPTKGANSTNTINVTVDKK